MLRLVVLLISSNNFFVYPGFLSRTLMTHRTTGEGKGPSFIPLYYFHPLTNIQSFTWNFACEMTIHIFNRTACIYQTAIRWVFPRYRMTIWSIDDVTLVFLVCLRNDLILAFCVTAIWDGKPVDASSHRLSPLYYKRTD